MKPLGYLSVQQAEQGERQPAEQDEQCSEEKQNSEECRGNADEMHEVAEDAHLFHRPQKLPVSRKIVNGSSSMARKSKVAEGKRNKGVEDESTSSDSDYEVDLEEEDNSSADDDEAIEFRKYARELKNKVRNKMLGEEDEKAVDVPEDFLVPEDCKLDDGDGDVTPYFDSADDLSYDETSDGDDMPKRKKTEHKVYDSTSEIPLFSVGMAFHDSREFKNALVKYGLKTYHHLLFPKDEKKRVSAKCSWPGCSWSIYGSITSRSDWFPVWRYNGEHACIPRRDNKLVTCGVIAKKYFRQIRDNPSWKAEHIQQAVLQDLVADVSISKCKRAKKLVMEKIIDLSDGEYAKPIRIPMVVIWQ